MRGNERRQYVRLSRARVNQTRLQTDGRGGEEKKRKKKVDIPDM